MSRGHRKGQNKNKPSQPLQKHANPRIESLKKDFLDSLLNNTPEIEIKIIEALLVIDELCTLQQIFGTEPLSNIIQQRNIELSEDNILKIASYLVQNNCIGSLEFFIKSYRGSLETNNRFIDFLAFYLTNKHRDIINILLKDLNFIRADGKNLLHRAVDIDNIELIRILSKEHAFMLNAVDVKGCTPVDYAIGYLRNYLYHYAPNAKNNEYILTKVIEGMASRYTEVDKKIVTTAMTILKAQDKKLSKKNDTALYPEVIKKFGSLPSQIDYPKGSKEYYVLTELDRSNREVVAAYFYGLFNDGYTDKNLKALKEKVINFRRLNESIENNDLSKTYKNIFNLFLLSRHEITLENFITFCTKGKHDTIEDKTKLYILTLLAKHNYEDGNKELALSQVEEAIKLDETLYESKMPEYAWYKQAMNYTYLLYVEIVRGYYKDGTNEKILPYLEKRRSYGQDEDFKIVCNMFVQYRNLGKLDSQGMEALLKSIKQPLSDFLRLLIDSIQNKIVLSSVNLDDILDDSISTKEKEACKDLLAISIGNQHGEFGEYDISFRYYTEKNEVDSVVHTCRKSRNTEMTKTAIKWIEDNYNALLGTNNNEIMAISKAVLCMFLKEFDNAVQALDLLDITKVQKIPNNYQEVFCKLCFDLAIEEQYGAKEALAKIKAVNPYSPELKILECYIEYLSFNNDESQPLAQEQDALVENKPELLSKEEVLALSEDDFLKACRAGKVKPGLKKAYTKHHWQTKAEKQLNDSIDKCYSKTHEPSYSWYIEKSEVLFTTENSVVFQINDNTWGVVDWDELRLDYLQRRQIENAITNYGKKNGVIIYDNLAKIVTDAGLRVYTTQKYKNEVGKYLIIFNKQGTHSKIRDVEVKEGEMEIINVKSTPPDTDINSTLNFSDHHNSSNNNVNYIGVGHQSVEIERECTCETIGKCEVHYEHYY